MSEAIVGNDEELMGRNKHSSHVLISFMNKRIFKLTPTRDLT